MAEGPKSEWNGFDYQYIGKRFKMPKGEIYAVLRVAGERIYLIGDDNLPGAGRFVQPDFNNLQPLAQILRGVKVADIV